MIRSLVITIASFATTALLIAATTATGSGVFA